jgi:hypothetical protein
MNERIRFILLAVRLRRRYGNKYLLNQNDTNIIHNCLFLEQFITSIAHRSNDDIKEFYDRNFNKLETILPNSQSLFFLTMLDNAFKFYLKPA